MLSAVQRFLWRTCSFAFGLFARFRVFAHRAL